MKEFTVLVPEMEYKRYVVKVDNENPYQALGSAMTESSYSLHRTTFIKTVPPEEQPWMVELDGEMVPFGSTADEHGQYWHVWGMPIVDRGESSK